MVVTKGHSLTMPLDLDSDVREKFLSSEDVSKYLKAAAADPFAAPLTAVSNGTAVQHHSRLSSRTDCSCNCTAKTDCHDSGPASGIASTNEKSGHRHPSLANNGLDSVQPSLIGQEEDSDGSGGTRTPELLCTVPNGSACLHGDRPDTLEGHSRVGQIEKGGQDYVGEGCRKKKKVNSNGLSKTTSGQNRNSEKSDDPASNKHPATKGQIETKPKKSSGLRAQFATSWVFGLWRKNNEIPREDELSADSGISGGSMNNGHLSEGSDSKKAKSKNSKLANGTTDVTDVLLEETCTLPNHINDVSIDIPTSSAVKTGKYGLISECIAAPPNCESVQIKCATDVTDRVDNLSALVGSINGAIGPPVFGDSPPEDHDIALSTRVAKSPAYTVFLPPSSMYPNCPGKEVLSSSSHFSTGTCASDMPLLSPKDLSFTEKKQRSPLLPTRSRKALRSSSMELSDIQQPGQLYQPHSSRGDCSQTSQDTSSSRRSGSSRYIEDDERAPEVGLHIQNEQNGFENNEDSGRTGGRRPAHVFSLKHLCSDRSHDPEPQGMPPDYVKIAMILLLPALPCALPALIWALKARRSCRLGEYTTAWQNSHRAFFCCFAALIGFAMLLLAIMVLTYTRNCPCEKTVLTTVSPLDNMQDRRVLDEPISGGNEMKDEMQRLRNEYPKGTKNLSTDNPSKNSSALLSSSSISEQAQYQARPPF